MRWQSAPIFMDTSESLPQHDKIQVYFNHNRQSSYMDPYRGHQRLGDNLEQVIIEAIESAQSQIDVAVQELRSPLIAKALRDRHQAGVKVRVVLENTYSRAWSDYGAAEVSALDDRLRSRYEENFQLIDQDENQILATEEIANFDAIKILKNANIPMLDDTEDGSKGSGLVHHKFVIVDRQTVVTTSANFTLSDLHGDLHIPHSQGNANSLIVIEDAAIAQAFSQEFNLLWGDGPGGNPNSQFGVNKPHRPTEYFAVGDAQIWVKFSPDSASIDWENTSNGFIEQQLAKSQEQINLALFVFSEQQLANRLAIVHKQGVKIKALIDKSFAFRPFSEGLDLLGVALSQNSDESSSCQVEAANQPWPISLKTVGTPKMMPGDLLHHKFAVIDQEMVIMGSHNWSVAANKTNDETLVAIAHPTVAKHYQREFDRLYTNSRLGLPDHIQDRWETTLAQCPNILQFPVEESEESQASSSALININQATQEELEALPGIGPKIAIAIMDARETQAFTTLEDLDQVPGIGPKTLETIRDRITFSDN